MNFNSITIFISINHICDPHICIYTLWDLFGDRVGGGGITLKLYIEKSRFIWHCPVFITCIYILYVLAVINFKGCVKLCCLVQRMVCRHCKLKGRSKGWVRVICYTVLVKGEVKWRSITWCWWIKFSIQDSWKHDHEHCSFVPSSLHWWYHEQGWNLWQNYDMCREPVLFCFLRVNQSVCTLRWSKFEQILK